MHVDRKRFCARQLGQNPRHKSTDETETRHRYSMLAARLSSDELVVPVPIDSQSTFALPFRIAHPRAAEPTITEALVHRVLRRRHHDVFVRPTFRSRSRRRHRSRHAFQLRIDPLPLGRRSLTRAACAAAIRGCSRADFGSSGVKVERRVVFRVERFKVELVLDQDAFEGSDAV